MFVTFMIVNLFSLAIDADDAVAAGNLASVGPCCLFLFLIFVSLYQWQKQCQRQLLEAHPTCSGFVSV